MEKQEFKEKAKKRIDEIFAKIDELEASKDKVKDDFREKYNESIADLKKKKDVLIARYNELDEAKDSKWAEVKDAFSDASDSFKEGFSKLTSIFKKD